MDFVTAAVICFIAGIIFLIVEMFTPGFGVSGCIGAILVIASAIIQADTLTEALLYIVICLIIIGIFAFFMIRSASKGRLSKTDVVLKSEVTDTGNDYTALLGYTGIAVVDLHPAGIAQINGKRYDVVALNGFIARDSQIVVDHVEGIRIVVRSV